MPPTRPKRTPKPVSRTLPSNPSTAGGAWTVSRILTSKSAVATKPTESFLALFLVFSTGWDSSYSDEEQRALIASLPAKYRVYERDPDTGRLRCPIDPAALFERPHLKQSISKLRTELEEGYHEVTWLNRARKATELRLQGVFDDYLRQHAEEVFGPGASAGENAQVREGSPLSTTGTGLGSSDGEWLGAHSEMKRSNK